MTEDWIWVVTDDKSEDSAENSKGLLDKFSGLKRIRVNSNKIEAEWRKVLAVVGRLLFEAEQQVGEQAGMKLDEVTIAVEINGKGQVSLMGVSGDSAGKGAITLTFRRP